jgi:hypothetical protein
MAPELARLLDRRPPTVAEAIDWSNGLRFLVAASLADEPPRAAAIP